MILKIDSHVCANVSFKVTLSLPWPSLLFSLHLLSGERVFSSLFQLRAALSSRFFTRTQSAPYIAGYDQSPINSVFK